MIAKLKVNEIYWGLQGECVHVGRPTVFVRLTGCNLRCGYCDSTYSYEEGKLMSVPSILEYVKKHSPTKLVEITGGEPLLQEGVYELMTALINEDYEVDLETNGSIYADPTKIPQEVTIILDMKVPSSGMSKKMDFKNLPRLGVRDQVKFVVQTPKDMEWARSILVKYPTNAMVYFSPVWSRINPKKIVQYIKKHKLNVYMSLQQHKILYGPTRRGV